MKKLILTLVAGLIPAGMASAQTTLADMDADGSGSLSLMEMQATYPSLTEDQFVALDINADGALDEAELAAATGSDAVVTE